MASSGVNFTNLLAQSSHFLVLTVILLRHSVSPTKLRPALPLQTTKKMLNLCVVRPVLCASKSNVILLKKNC
jgi:hypothetical protein